jgi:uncharacterized protein (TIGR02453 family)
MINRDTLEFLKELEKNNNREWFQANKTAHDKARENVISFCGDLIAALHKTDPDIDEALDPKKCVQRIYRDIRFSLNKTPYKTNFGMGIPTTGLRNGGVEYYMHVQPGNCFIGGGYWMPDAEQLKKIRQEIDYNARDLKTIIDAPEFITLFGDFRKQEQLKTVPKGYGAENENLDLLKLKSFISWHTLKDEELSTAGAVDKIALVCTKLHPLTVFLKNALA